MKKGYYLGEGQWSIGTVKSALRQFRRKVLDYNQNPDKFIRKYTVVINGKKRNIVTYTMDENGFALRQTHYLFVWAIRYYYTFSEASFAYQRGKNVRLCLEKHMDHATFFKTDIHSFFESINVDILYQKIKENVKVNTVDDKFWYDVLQSCFYQGKMPIGFVTSPILSDIYLHEFDAQLMFEPEICYTRYADDIIISSSNDAMDFTSVQNKIVELLDQISLTLNNKKTYVRRLNQPGDAIRLLGLNMVKTEGPRNRLTVSDKYIRKTSKEFSDFLNEREYLDPSKAVSQFYQLCGKINFIRDASSCSYEKLLKMLFVKTGRSWDCDPVKLRNALLPENAAFMDEEQRSPEFHRKLEIENQAIEYFRSWKYDDSFETDLSVSATGISRAAYTKLSKNNITRVSQIINLSYDEILQFKGIGPQRAKEIMDGIAWIRPAYEAMISDMSFVNKYQTCLQLLFHRNEEKIRNAAKLRKIMRQEIAKRIYQMYMLP